MGTGPSHPDDSQTHTKLAARISIADAIAMLLSEHNHVRLVAPDGAEAWLADLDRELDTVRSTTVATFVSRAPTVTSGCATENDTPRRIALADELRAVIEDDALRRSAPSGAPSTRPHALEDVDAMDTGQ